MDSRERFNKLNLIVIQDFSFCLCKSKLNIVFPTHEVYRQPINLSTYFLIGMIHTKEEEFMFNGEKIKIENKYVI